MSSVAVITGGQRGIGLGIAQVLVDAGFTVALISNADQQEVDAAIEVLGDGARFYAHDLQSIGAIPALVQRIEGDLGPINTLVSNAGVPAASRGDMLDVPEASFDRVMDINLKGGFFLAQAVARRMLLNPAKGYQSLIFVTSVSAQMASIERAEYCMSKAGASMMSQLFAVRLAADGIGVFELQPGIIATGMTAGVQDKYTDLIADGLVPARRWGQPADIGQIVLPLVQGQMAFATGAVIPVDGGLSIPRL
jgi:NAD(P)-dependent dehydrogenase (short-subunit alcohol dehydrogenase family)